MQLVMNVVSQFSSYYPILCISLFEQRIDRSCIVTGKRKLKCSGDPTGCERCIKQSIVCHYSIQKPMGRPPKKRRREEDQIPESSTEDPGQIRCSDPTSLTAARDGPPTQEALHVFPFSSASTGFPDPLNTGDSRYNVPQPDQSLNYLLSIPATASPWPDFSTVSASSSSSSILPVFQEIALHSTSPQGGNSTGDNTECACLSYLYLCLSHLSTTCSFPITQQTLCSLYIAAKTARDVVRCKVCPRTFATGMQNVMLTGTLLNIIADGWVRVSKADAADLGRQSAFPQHVAFINSTPDPAGNWKIWLRQVVRHALIGGPTTECAKIQCSSSPDLLSIIKELESRQRSWHSGRGSHPLHQKQSSDSNGHSPLTEEDCDEKDILCLRVVGSARLVIDKLNFEPHEYPDGVVS